MKTLTRILALVTTIAVWPATASAQAIDSGDTAWMLTSTALVLFMTLPGLALFYGGLASTALVVGFRWEDDRDREFLLH